MCKQSFPTTGIWIRIRRVPIAYIGPVGWKNMRMSSIEIETGSFLHQAITEKAGAVSLMAQSVPGLAQQKK